MVYEQHQVTPYSGGTGSSVGVRKQDVFSEAWQRTLRESEKYLTTIIEGTENEFLLIGEKLSDFHERAISISDISSSITGLLSGDEIVRTIGGLKELLRKITSYHERFAEITRTRMKQLDNILKKILNISEPLSEFRDITKTLRTLCTTTKIQSALIGNAARGFVFLADDVKELSAMIDARADGITNDLKMLETLSRQTYTKLQMFEVLQREKVAIILKNTDAALSSLSEKYSLSKSAAEDVLARTTGITLSVGDIVTSAQYHDITRQRFEQVRQVIRDRYTGAGRGSGGTVTGHEPDAGQEDIRRSEFGSMLIAGLSMTMKEFSAAVGSIVGSLISIWKNITDVLKEIAFITRDSGPGHRTVIAEVEHSLSAVTSALLSLSESAESDKELSAALRSLSGTTGEISQFIEDINRIGESLKLISWNSNIKAEEIGKAGASLSVVADFIKKMADDAHAKSFDVSGALASVTHAIGELSSQGSEGSVIDESDIREMTGRMEDMNGLFRNMNDSLQSFLREIETEGWKLASHIENVARNIDVHHTVGRIVREIIARIEVLPFPAALTHDHALARPLFLEGIPAKAVSIHGNHTGEELKHENVELF